MFFSTYFVAMNNLISIYSSPESSDYGPVSTEKRFSGIFDSLLVQSLSVLDYGCGPGNLCEWFETKSKLPKEYYGYDIRKETVLIAKQKHPKWSFSDCLPLAGNKYDTVLMIGTISYAFDSDISVCKSTYLKEISTALSYLKSDGYAYITARKKGKEHGINKKLMITYSAEEIDEMFDQFEFIDLFEHEWLIKTKG